MSSGRLRTVVAFVGIPIGLFFLWLAVRNADLDAVWESVREADARLVALAVGAFAAVYVFQSARWRRIAATPEVGLPRFYEMTVSGVAVNNVLPGRIGDFLRARWLGLAARECPQGRHSAPSSSTVHSTWSFSSVSSLWESRPSRAPSGSCSWPRRVSWWSSASPESLLISRKYVERRDRGRHERGLVRRLVRDTVERLAEPLGRRHLLVWLGLSLGAWAMWAVAALLVARSLDVELSLTEALFVAAVLNLGSAVPSSPGYVGTYEWLGVASLGLLGIDNEPALAFTILLHATWYVPTTLFGAIALGTRAVVRLRRRR